jgi:hypothetical protein
MRLLVAENDPSLGIFLQRGFGAERYSVDLTQNGEQARSLVRENEYDLAILDLSLPKEEGVEAAADSTGGADRKAHRLGDADERGDCGEPEGSGVFRQRLGIVPARSGANPGGLRESDRAEADSGTNRGAHG